MCTYMCLLPQISEIIWYLCYWDWLISLSMNVCNCIPVCICILISLSNQLLDIPVNSVM